MADKQSRLAEIYKAEKTKGGGITSTLGKRALEKMDPRKFFNQKGFLATALPSLFKSYSATPTKTGEKLASAGGASFSSGALETKLDILTGETRELKIHSKIAAKNSSVLPSMARDMNVTRQNIVKLVKLQSGTATTKADMFFKRAGDRETAYESRFNKAGGVATKTPTQIGAKPEEKKKGIFDYILDFLPTIFKGLLVAGIIGQFLKDPETFKIVKEFATNVLIKFFDGVTASFNLLTDLFDNEDVQKSIRDSVSSIFGAIAKFFSIKLTTFSTPFGDVDVTLGGAIAAVVGGFALFKGAMFGTGLAIAKLGEAAALAAGRMAMGGGPGSAGSPGGKPGNKARGGWMRGLGAAVGIGVIGKGIQYYLEQGESEEDARKLAQEDIDKQKLGLNPGEEIVPSLTKPEGMRGSEITGYATNAAVGASLLKGGLSGLPSAPSTVPSTAASGKPLTSFGSVGANREMEKNKPLWEKISKVMKKAYDKGVSTEMLSKIRKKFGFFIFGKLTAVLGGVVAAPFSVGASLLISVFGAALLVSDLIELYDWFIEYEKELDAYEKSLSPTPVVAPIVPVVPTPAPYNAARDSQAANPTNTKPTPAPSGDYASRIGGRESGGNYDTIFGKAGGATINGKLVTENTIGEVAAWQAGEREKKSNKQAAGKYQFMDVVAAAKLAGLGPNDLFNGQNQEKMMTAYTESNAKQLRAYGLPDTEEYLSMAHAVGAKGTKQLIDAQNAGMGDANSLDILGLKGAAAKTNPQLNTNVDTTIAALKGGGPMGHGSGTMLAKNKSNNTLAAAPELKMPTLGTLTAAAPTMGDMIDSATSTFTDALRMFDSALSSITNITNNNTQTSTSAQQSQGNLPSVYDDVFLNLFQRVT